MVMLDRNAPENDGYCDFNINCIQASAGAAGNSSGSPIINDDGYTIALQAGEILKKHNEFRPSPWPTSSGSGLHQRQRAGRERYYPNTLF
jgi:hypothetical protein